jgi:hypothetical protein
MFYLNYTYVVFIIKNDWLVNTDWGTYFGTCFRDHCLLMAKGGISVPLPLLDSHTMKRYGEVEVKPHSRCWHLGTLAFRGDVSLALCVLRYPLRTVFVVSCLEVSVCPIADHYWELDSTCRWSKARLVVVLPKLFLLITRCDIYVSVNVCVEFLHQHTSLFCSVKDKVCLYCDVFLLSCLLCSG